MEVRDIITPLQSRFFVVELPPYTYEQFNQVSVHLLTEEHKVSQNIAYNRSVHLGSGLECSAVHNCNQDILICS